MNLNLYLYLYLNLYLYLYLYCICICICISSGNFPLAGLLENPFCPSEWPRVAQFCVCYHNKSDSTPGIPPALSFFLKENIQPRKSKAHTHATIVIFSVVVMIRSIELNEVYTVYTTFHYFWTMKRVPLRKSVKKCIVFIFNNLHNSLIMKFPSSLSLSKAKDNFTFQTHNIDHLDNIFKSIWMSRFSAHITGRLMAGGA